MTETPALSPWPAPTLADAAPQSPATVQVVEAPHRHPIATLLTTARRLSSRTERAEHAALKEEQRIHDELADLPAGWFVLHSPELAEFGAEDHPVDHVAIGPGGVFTIHVEHQSGAKVWVSERSLVINGRDTGRLRQARFEARRSGSLLTDACGFNVTVQSVLVLIGAATVQTVSRPAEVHVRTQHDLRDWLCTQPQRLDFDSVTAIHDRLRPADPSPADSLIGLLE